MGLDFLRRLGGLGKLGGEVGANLHASVSGTLGVKAGLTPPIAVDFGVGSLKVLQVSQGDAGPVLTAAACLDTPDDLLHNDDKRLDFQIEALPKLIKRGGFKGRRAVCSLPAWQTMCKQLQFQRAEGVPTSELVAGAVATQLNIDPNSIVFRYIDVGGPGAASGKAEIICIAASRQTVDRLMKALSASKLDPVGIHSEFHAMVRAFEWVNRRAEDQTTATMYVDMGCATTKLAIAHGTELVFARSMEFGGRVLDDTVVKQLRVDIGEARRQRREYDAKMIASMETPASRAVETKIKQATAAAVGAGVGAGGASGGGVATERRAADGKPGIPAGFSGDLRSAPHSSDWVPPKVDLKESVEILADDIHHCMRYYSAMFPGKKVDKAVFVGGEARYRGLCQQIARAIRLPTQMADPLARVVRTGNEPCVGVDLKVSQPGWAVAFGMTMSPTDL